MRELEGKCCEGNRKKRHNSDIAEGVRKSVKSEESERLRTLISCSK